jgi:hypothetical protein
MGRDAPLHRGLAAWDVMRREGIERGGFSGASAPARFVSRLRRSCCFLCVSQRLRAGLTSAAPTALWAMQRLRPFAVLCCPYRRIEHGNSKTRGKFTRERCGAARRLVYVVAEATTHKDFALRQRRLCAGLSSAAAAFPGLPRRLGLCRAYGARPAFCVFPSAYALG